MPFTGPLSVTVGHLRIRFHGEGHRSIADRRLHMFRVEKNHRKLSRFRQCYIRYKSNFKLFHKEGRIELKDNKQNNSSLVIQSIVTMKRRGPYFSKAQIKKRTIKNGNNTIPDCLLLRKLLGFIHTKIKWYVCNVYK